MALCRRCWRTIAEGSSHECLAGTLIQLYGFPHKLICHVAAVGVLWQAQVFGVEALAQQFCLNAYEFRVWKTVRFSTCTTV